MPNNRKPIIVSNPNDPRLRAYKDSLDFYSFNKKALDKVLKTNKSSLGSPVDVSKKRYITREQDINEAYNRYKSLGLDITKKDVSDESDAFDTTKGGKLIRKTGSYNFPIKGGGIFRLAQYKKPEQPVEYRREDIPILTPKTPTLNIEQTINTPKPLPITNTVTPEVTPKKLPGGSGKFAQYPNMKKQLGSLETTRMVNSRKVKHIVPTFENGVNLVAGGEKHRVYVKKSPTGVGKGVKGHVMVNHPTTDKGKWDTIDLTEKAGAKTVEDGKAATRKWHAENPYKMQKGNKSLKSVKPSYKDYLKTVNPDFLGPDYNLEEAYKNLPYETMRAWAKDPNRNHLPDTYKLPNHPTFSNESMYYKPGMKAGKWEGDKYIPIGDTLKKLSGAKSVKQYRGDENLPEARKGMKNCGCKHSKSKYKYQSGNKNIAADDLEFERMMNPSSEFEGLPDVPYDFPLPKAKVKTAKIVSIKRDTVPVKKKTYPTVSGEKKVYIEKAPVTKTRVVPTSTDRATEYFNNYDGESVFPGNKRYQTVDGKMVITKRERFGKKNLGYDWEDLSNAEKDKVTNLYKQQRRDILQREIDVMNASMKYRTKPKTDIQSGGMFARSQKAKELKEMQANVKRITSAVEGKSPYKYGTGALTIPEGSAIVTANGGKNKQAIAAYKKGNYKLLNSIIEDMPEDNVDKAQAGKKSTKGKTIEGIVKKRPVIGSNKTFTEQSALGYGGGYGREMSEEAAKKMYNLSLSDYIAAVNSGKIPKVTADLETARREAVNKGLTKFDYKGKSYLSGLEEDVKPVGDDKNKVEEKPKEDLTAITPEVKDQTFAGDKRKGNFLSNIPAMAEIAARTSILGKGIENVPENYLKLGRYQYASQLPKTLREIQLAEQAGRESARDVVAGDAGRYLAQAGNLSAARMKEANDAVIQDTLARQDIANKNIDLGNVEAQANTALKTQFAQQRAMARAAYDQQLIGLGQRIDSATETAQEMAGQRAADEQRLQTLRDLGVNYDVKDIDGLLKLVPKTASKTAAKGLKKAKAYKRK